MGYIHFEQREVFPGAAGTAAPVIYVIDSPEHPFDVAEVAHGRIATIAKVPIGNWNDALTPWPAAGIYRGEPDFGGYAAATLDELCHKTIPAIEAVEHLSPAKRAICGYSLGGLFALYAFAHGGTFFDACAGLSASVWYEGWVEHLRDLDLDGAGRFAFLSIGSKEKHAAPKILHHAQSDMEQCAIILREHGAQTEFVVGPGNHMAHALERLDAGLAALDGFLAI